MVRRELAGLPEGVEALEAVGDAAGIAVRAGEQGLGRGMAIGSQVDALAQDSEQGRDEVGEAGH